MLARIGSNVRTKVQSVLYGLGFFFNVLKETVRFFRRSQVGYKVLIMQILFTGFEALTISAVMAVAIGAAINVIGSSLLPQFGQSRSSRRYLVLVPAITDGSVFPSRRAAC